MKTLLGMPFFRTLLTEVEAEAEGVAVSSTQIDEALTLSGQTGQAWTDAALHRIRGDIQLKADPGNPVPAEVAYLASIAIAREQGARRFGLQAALKLAKLYQSTGRPLEARDILAPALEGFLPNSGNGGDRRGAGDARRAGGDEESERQGVLRELA